MTPDFYMLVVAQQDFFLTEVLFFHKPPESSIMGVSDIGQVSTAMSTTYFKVFLSTKKINETLPFCYKGEILKDTEQKISTQESICDQI